MQLPYRKQKAIDSRFTSCRQLSGGSQASYFCKKSGGNFLKIGKSGAPLSFLSRRFTLRILALVLLGLIDYTHPKDACTPGKKGEAYEHQGHSRPS